MPGHRFKKATRRSRLLRTTSQIFPIIGQPKIRLVFMSSPTMTQNRKLLILPISFWMALAIIYFKFFDVSRAGGVILGEPDEFAHSQIVARLPATRGPFYSGKPFFYDPPFFFWASSLLNLAFK